MSAKPNFCSNCGEKLDMTQDIEECPKCRSALHEHLNHGQTSPPVVQQLPYKSPGTTALIAFLGGIAALPGIGHMYVGKVRRGIIILIGGFLLFFIPLFLLASLYAPLQHDRGFEGPDYPSVYSVGFLIGYGLIPASLIYLAYFIWQIFDARKLAKKFNEAIITTQKEPW
jgi:TM2 domain-containing membrane protein YozV